VLILVGSGFIIAGALGIMRLPDVYTRMHAASVIETLGAGALFAGFMLQAGFNQVTLKLLFILILFFFTGPVITHALAQAALHAGLKPELDEDRRDRMLDDKAGGTARPDAGRLP
jgi:multicomponent Na+:H+ antiporter subunit G